MKPARHQRQVGRRFSAAAAGYYLVSRVQQDVARRVIDLVPGAATPRRVLDVGCGTGCLTALARSRWPRAAVVGLDVAPGMIAAARARFARDARVSFTLVGAEAYRDDHPFDLVVSSSAMQWLRPFKAGLDNVFSLVLPGGYLVAGLMTRDTLHELRSSREAVAPNKQAPGRLPGLGQVRRAVAALPPCRILLQREERWETRYANASELLRTLHGTGATGGDVSQGAAPLNRRELRELAAYYDRTFPAVSGGVRATFCVGFLVLERI